MPSSSNTAIRSSIGTKLDEDAFVTFCTKSMPRALADDSFHDGRGACAKDVAALIAMATEAKLTLA